MCTTTGQQNQEVCLAASSHPHRHVQTKQENVTQDNESIKDINWKQGSSSRAASLDLDPSNTNEPPSFPAFNSTRLWLTPRHCHPSEYVTAMTHL